MVIDGEVGFIGGAGIASHWIDGDPPSRGKPAGPPWRDTVCRVTGDLVTGLQTTFAENWLESSGEILSGDEYFPLCRAETADRKAADAPPRRRGAAGAAGRHRPRGLVVISTPSAARSTRARIVFQILLACARKSIHINSPYFVPDRSVVRRIVQGRRGAAWT